MSNSPKKKFKLPKQPEPRDAKVIEEEYGKLVAQSGQCQYYIYVYKKDLERINEQLRNLNYEAAARKQLNDKAAKEATQTSRPLTDASQESAGN